MNARCGSPGCSRQARRQGTGLPRPGEEKAMFVRTLFDTIAPRYDLMNRLMTAGFYPRWQRCLAAVTGLGPGGHALDVCCGTGDLGLIMARQVAPGGRVVGVDFSPRMLEIARRKAARGQAAAVEIEFVRGDALDLPFPDGSFDCAVIGFALRNVNDIPRCLAEMARVVRPGGRVLALEVCRPPSPWVRAWFYPYFHSVVPLLGVLAGFVRGVDEGSPPERGHPRPRGPMRPRGHRAQRRLRPYGYLPRSLAYLPGLEELADALRSAGLTGVNYRVLPPGVVALHQGTVPDRCGGPAHGAQQGKGPACVE